MKRTLKDYLVISLKGVAMGAADTVPGVSGGTIAFISGIYEELIYTISNIDLSLLRVWKKEGFNAFWKKLNGNFIIALLGGILFSIFTFMRLANYLLENHPVLIWSFFFGLVLSSIWFVAKQIEKWNVYLVIQMILGSVVAFYITLLPPLVSNDNSWFLFLAGSIAICAMILPGISGAFILVLLGAYKNITEAVHNFDFKKIAVVGLGAITGLLIFSRILKWLFKNYKNSTLAILTGFIAGSLNKIWPWKHTLETVTIGDKEFVMKEESVLPWNFDGEPQLLFSILLMLVGFILIVILEKIAEEKPEHAPQ
ncbi:DUF368 domain-containing protein [Mesonia sp. K7]|uniref:DUF368 domain-containing protein n=1 Tax=Mesonia sp. K7 TaxID=2218606 RepID=UPI000DAA77B6|nr:DUF368 domain-containing protein [Mesonia sp. K7]PZD79464.1 DUF368 domain-containing protein [Mesonia sp. K7]